MRPCLWLALALLSGCPKSDPPSAPPRYQLSAPEDVRSAIAAADQALSSKDEVAARAAMAKARHAIGRWAERMPGARGARLFRISESFVVDPSAAGGPPESREQLQARWEKLKSDLQSKE